MNTLAIYLKESKYETLKAIRRRSFAMATILFPAMFYVFFGLMGAARQPLHGVTVSLYLIATYGTFGVFSVGIFGFGVGVSTERGLGWLQVKRASPMPPLAYFVAKTAVCVVFALTIVLVLFGLGFFFGGVRVPIPLAVELALTLLAVVAPFCAMGLAIGYFAPAQSAPIIANMIYLPMSFCSGLWIPFDYMPHQLQLIAPYLPTYHAGQIALGVIGAGRGESTIVHWLALVAFTLIAVGIAALGYRREEQLNA